MKIVNLLLQIVISLLVISVVTYFLTGYDSAFEADQLCHSYLSSGQSPNQGCDHDTETHQWILFETQDNADPAIIIKKFRYKFL